MFCNAFYFEVTAVRLLESSIVVLPVYQSDKGNFDSFLDVFDNCLNSEANPNMTVFVVGNFNVPLTFDTPAEKRISDLLPSYGL